MRVWITAGLVLCSLTGAFFNSIQRATAPKSGDITRDGEQKVIATDPDDAELNAAMAKGKETYKEFEALFAEPANRVFLVKMGMRNTSGIVEYVWLADIRESHGRVVGTLDNEPYGDVGVKQGDIVVVRPRDVRDWIVYDEKSDKVYGGFTIPILEKRMKRK